MRDAQGHQLSGATMEAIGHFDQAVRAFTLLYGDALRLYEAARNAAPEFVMAYFGKAWPLSLANDPQLNIKARVLLDGARDLPMNERECAHLAALSHAVKGHRAAAVAVLDRHLMRYPFDLVAHMAALQMDGHLGRFPLARNRSARTLPRWSKTQPGYGICCRSTASDRRKRVTTPRLRRRLVRPRSWSHTATGRITASPTSWK